MKTFINHEKKNVTGWLHCGQISLVERVFHLLFTIHCMCLQLAGDSRLFSESQRIKLLTVAIIRRECETVGNFKF